MQPGLLELVADADERPAQPERLGEDVEQRGPLLERVDQAAVGADLLAVEVVEQVGRAADVELAVVLDVVEGPAQDRRGRRARAARSPARRRRGRAGAT